MQDAPSFHRNKQPMLEVLQKVLPQKPHNILEIASGSGQHGPFFTDHIPNLTWWPSDIDQRALRSINEWREHLKSQKIMPPQILDVTSHFWRDEFALDNWPNCFTAILSMNMIHIAPQEAGYGLLKGAPRHLCDSGLLIFYGPFKRNGIHTAQTNQAFDESLKSRNPDWGIRNLEHIIEKAGENGLHHLATHEMPANNLSVIFEKM